MYLVWWVHFAQPTTIEDIAERSTTQSAPAVAARASAPSAAGMLRR